jgi:ATP-binding cassette, subfamily B, bacterial MsbA
LPTYRKQSDKTNQKSDAMNEMIIRQSSAHPMSEFLGTCVIVTVLLFGGALILNTNYAPMDAATFIFYLIILYSIINPLKEFSRAFYNIPQGLASMERIDMILKAEVIVCFREPGRHFAFGYKRFDNP